MDKVFELAMESLLVENQKALSELADNFPIPVLGPLMKLVSFPLGLPYKGK